MKRMLMIFWRHHVTLTAEGMRKSPDWFLALCHWAVVVAGYYYMMNLLLWMFFKALTFGLKP